MLFMLWQGDEQAYDLIFSEAIFKTHNFRIRAKMETYNVRHLKTKLPT